MTRLTLSERQTNGLLYAVQGVGAVFVALFLAAYLGGLPTTNVLHSEPIFRWLLTIFGGVFLVLIAAVVAVAVLVTTEK